MVPHEFAHEVLVHLAAQIGAEVTTLNAYRWNDSELVALDVEALHFGDGGLEYRPPAHAESSTSVARQVAENLSSFCRESYGSLSRL